MSGVAGIRAGQRHGGSSELSPGVPVPVSNTTEQSPEYVKHSPPGTVTAGSFAARKGHHLYRILT